MLLQMWPVPKPPVLKLTKRLNQHCIENCFGFVIQSVTWKCNKSNINTISRNRLLLFLFTQKPCLCSASFDTFSIMLSSFNLIYNKSRSYFTRVQVESRHNVDLEHHIRTRRNTASALFKHLLVNVVCLMK